MREVNGDRTSSEVNSEAGQTTRRLIDIPTYVDAVIAGGVSQQEVVSWTVERMVADRNNALMATRTEGDLATDLARQLHRASEGDPVPLLGLPIGVKDIIDVRGLVQTLGTRVIGPRSPRSDAQVVSQAKQAGVLIAAMTASDEFAYACTGAQAAQGPTLNPYDPERISGGSSSGSAAVVASGCLPVAIGTDTGGSVRVPSALCGAVGMKPTMGLLSTEGIYPVSRTLDHVGVIAATVRDNAYAMRSISGVDRMSVGCDDDVDGIILGRFPPAALGHVHPDVAHALVRSLKALGSIGVRSRTIDEDLLNEPLAAQRSILAFEAYQVHSQLLARYEDRYVPATAARLRANSYVTRTDFAHASAVREATMARIERVFGGCDAIMLPTVPMPAVRQHETSIDTDRGPEPIGTMYTRFTGLANLLGIPALSVPVGFSSWGVPVAVQILGPPSSEPLLYALGSRLEDAGLFDRTTDALPTWFEMFAQSRLGSQRSLGGDRGVEHAVE